MFLTLTITQFLHCVRTNLFIFLIRYSDDLKDRNDEKCDCLNDCEMVHFFSTMQKEAFNKYSTETRPQHWFDKGNKIRPPSGILANYLLDPENIFSNQLAKNLTKLANNMSLNKDLAEKRFYEVTNYVNSY